VVAVCLPCRHTTAVTTGFCTLISSSSASPYASVTAETVAYNSTATHPHLLALFLLLLVLTHCCCANCYNLCTHKQAATVREYGRGSLVGETALLQRAPHTLTVHATRPSSVARIPGSVLALLAARHPSIITHLAQHSADRARGRVGGARSKGALQVTALVQLAVVMYLFNLDHHLCIVRGLCINVFYYLIVLITCYLQCTHHKMVY
jgi:hypothetical protein